MKKAQKLKNGMALVLNGTIDFETYKNGKLILKENVDGETVLKLIISVLTNYMDKHHP